jgi:hypothetical protein
MAAIIEIIVIILRGGRRLFTFEPPALASGLLISEQVWTFAAENSLPAKAREASLARPPCVLHFVGA